MDEAIRIVKGLRSERSFTLEGRRYRTEGAELEPKPDHRIPIWLGTFGNRALGVTGRLADGWIPSLGFAPPEQAAAMRKRILISAREAGRDPEAITCAYNLEVLIDDHADAQPSMVSGSAGAVAEQLIGFVGMGFTAFNFMVVGPGKDEQAERLAREVVPAVREAVAA